MPSAVFEIMTGKKSSSKRPAASNTGTLFSSAAPAGVLVKLDPAATTVAPVPPVPVPAASSAPVAISTLPLTLVVASGAPATAVSSTYFFVARCASFEIVAVPSYLRGSAG